MLATASHVHHWLLIEYRGLWGRRVLGSSTLSDAVKAHLTEQLGLLSRSKLLFIRRPERRGGAMLKCYFGRSLEAEQRFFELDLEGYDDLLGVDFAGELDAGAGHALDHPLFVVCTHGKRDRCCARYGRPLYEELRDQADEDWAWQSTHVGGDRFAGNVVCLPHGLYFGRVGRVDVWPLLEEYLGGRIHLERFRGRSCHSFPVQVAERAVRSRARLAGIADVSVSAVGRSPEGWRVELLAVPHGQVHEVDVVAELGDLAYLTCTSATLQRPRRFLVTRHVVRPPR